MLGIYDVGNVMESNRRYSIGNGSITIRWMALVLSFGLFLIGCSTPPSWFPQAPTATYEIPKKQPEPSRPLVKGEISGIPDDTLVTIRIETLNGWDAVTAYGRLSSTWKAVVTEASGLDYYVTAEAEGYVSQPESYMFHLSGETAYLVRDGQVTDEEAIHLDFHFVPSQSP